MPHARFLLIIVINLWNVHATKYCSYELNGDPKYFVCARNEYCCNLGCCVHLAFQFYQLWYYWLLLIFMFMICSGGSWWYKFCRRTESSSSHYPSIPLAIDRPGRHNMAEVHGRRAAARAFDRTSANDPSSYHFHRIWKANNLAASPNYYSASVVRYQNSDADSRRQHYECPYYQLYGPPPSYESVVRISESGNDGQTSCALVPSSNILPAPLYSSLSPQNMPTSVPSSSQDDKGCLPKTTNLSVPGQEQDNMPEQSNASPSSDTPSPVEISPAEDYASLPLPVREPQPSRFAWPTNTQRLMPTIADAPKCFPTKDQHNFYRKHHQSHHLLHQPTIHNGDTNSTLETSNYSTSSSGCRSFSQLANSPLSQPPAANLAQALPPTSVSLPSSSASQSATPTTLTSTSPHDDCGAKM